MVGLPRRRARCAPRARMDETRSSAVIDEAARRRVGRKYSRSLLTETMACAIRCNHLHIPVRVMSHLISPSARLAYLYMR